jgi:predicted O-linked N-acetylglucosamine transferase (SPINDLY family)
MVSGKVGARFSSWSAPIAAERLRVGLVSGDLLNHPVGYFVESLLCALDPSRIELFAYPTQPLADALTARIQPRFAAWRPLYGRSDAAAAKLIHDDGLHVLIDLSGHTAHNRLPVFAWKPAPVQVSWLGYFATTGLAEIDYLLADAVSVPPEHHDHFTEKIWYLPDTRLCFTPPAIDVPVTPLPAQANGYVTLGSFQNLAKLGEAVLDRWGRILAALPNARLRVQNKQLADPGVRAQLIERLRRAGIEPERVALHGPMPRRDYLAAHAEVDFIVDTFPFPGGTTTCEALWMGVPTLTLAGDRLIARQGASLLAAAGLNDWIAHSEAEYVEQALAFARDVPALAALRSSLRAQALRSPLFDATGFARNFECALRKMWRRSGTNQ